MSKLILHVGMPKTGSSYIQGILNKNKGLIEESLGIRALTGISPHVVACHLISDINLLTRPDILSLREKYNLELENTINEYAKKSELVVISSEYFYLCEPEVVKKFFADYFKNFEIVLVVRRQDKLLSSGYNQDVKALGRTSNLTWDVENGKKLDYWNYCESWSPCTVRCIDYDTVKKQKNGLISAFFALFIKDYNAIANQLVNPNDNSKNLSLSHKEVLLKLAMNRNGLGEKNEILDEFSNFLSDKQPFEMPSAYENVIASHYRPSNLKLIAKYLNNDLNSELAFNELKHKGSHNKFAWNPLSGYEEILEYLLKNISEEKK